ncbi:MAG TPA: hypothetical protein VMS55_23780 [Myxococcota bacterium]|nr:hypothetical protein [Myxococcota bacterium]
MGADRLTRGLLLAILACLLFLVTRDLRRGDAGRFSVTPLRAGSPVLVRTDTATGESWRLDLRAGGERWVPIQDAGQGPVWEDMEAANPADTPAPHDAAAAQRPLASDEIKALANAILGDELAPDIRIWAVGQLAATPDRRATLALIQLYDVVDDPQLAALIREALAQRDDPRAKRALERHAQAPGSS